MTHAGDCDILGKRLTAYMTICPQIDDDDGDDDDERKRVTLL